MPTPSYDTDAGLFVPTTNIWDVAELYETDVNSDQFKELLVRLYQNVNNIALSLNIKDSAYYTLNEFVNGQLFFPASLASNASEPQYRQVYRLVVNFGALPNAGTKSVAHGLPVGSTWTFTRIYGCATNPSTEFIPLPYASPTLNQNISLNVDATNVNVTTAINYSAYTTTYIVLEYLKY